MQDAIKGHVPHCPTDSDQCCQQQGCSQLAWCDFKCTPWAKAFVRCSWTCSNNPRAHASLACPGTACTSRIEKSWSTPQPGAVLIQNKQKQYGAANLQHPGTSNVQRRNTYKQAPKPACGSAEHTRNHAVCIGVSLPLFEPRGSGQHEPRMAAIPAPSTQLANC